MRRAGQPPLGERAEPARVGKLQMAIVTCRMPKYELPGDPTTGFVPSNPRRSQEPEQPYVTMTDSRNLGWEQSPRGLGLQR